MNHQVPKSRYLSRRLAAMLYDSLVVIALMFVATLPWVWMSVSGHYRVFYQIYLFSVMSLYFVISWVRGGQTIGMRAWRIRLVSRRYLTIGYLDACARWLLLWAMHITVIGWLRAFIWPHRELWQDKISGTQMVLVKRR